MYSCVGGHYNVGLSLPIRECSRSVGESGLCWEDLLFSEMIMVVVVVVLGMAQLWPFH